MTVYDLCSLYIEDTEEVKIYSISKEEYVFDGFFREATYCDYSDDDVQSFGIEDGIICINIE